MKSSVVLVLVFLVFGITADPYYLRKEGSKTDEPITNTGTNDFVDSITVTAPQAGPFDDDTKAFLFIELTHPVVTELEITLTNPASVKKTIINAGRDYSCHGEDISATFSDIARVHADWVLERCDEEQVPFYSGDLRGVEDFSPASGDNEGTWTLTINNECANGETGTLKRWGIIFAADIDNDTIVNSDDNCPTTYNPYVGATGFQADENQNGIGNACECDSRNYQDASAGKRKICLLLENWGYNKRFYKGMRKNPGDWAEAVVPVRNFDVFQPGDYTDHNTWLDCHCNEHEVLP